MKKLLTALLVSMVFLPCIYATDPPHDESPLVLRVDENFADPKTYEFTTIQDALDYIDSDGAPADTYHIVVHPGTYEEVPVLDRDNLTIEGTSRDAVILQRPSASYSRVIVVGASNITLRNLTFDGYVESSDPVDIIMELDLDSGQDDLLVEGCRFANGNHGVQIELPTTNPQSHYSSNIVLQENLFELREVAVRIKQYYSDGPHGLDFTSRDNTIRITSPNGLNEAVAFEVWQLSRDSRFRSINDVIDMESSITWTQGTYPDVNGYAFFDYMPAVSEITGAQIRLAHTGRTHSGHGFVAVKIHGPSQGITMPAQDHVVLINGVNVQIEDQTTASPGGGASVFGIWNDRVTYYVSGCAVAWNIADPDEEDFQKRTFVIGSGWENSRILHVGTNVIEDDHSVSEGDGTIEALDQYQLKTVDLEAKSIAADGIAVGNSGLNPATITLTNTLQDWKITADGSNLYFRTDTSDQRNVKFDNQGTGGINFIITKGYLAPDSDNTCYVGAATKRWRGIYGRDGDFEYGFFSDALEIPKVTTTPSLDDRELVVDDSGTTKRLCVGIDGTTYCADLTALE